MGAGAGCTVPNPSYDQGSETAPQTAEGTAAGTGEPGTTAVGDATSTAAGSAEGSESGLRHCEDPPAGARVTVVPTHVAPMDLCGFEDSRLGLLELFGGQYRLHLAGECMEGEPVTITFAPKGPSFSEGTRVCVKLEIRYRADCSFEAATVREDATNALIFAAATNPESHVPELHLELGDPVGDVCDCGSAACCEGVPAPGLYTVDASTLEGESDSLAQGEQTTFSSGNDSFELAIPQARVTDDCERPVLVDWYYRHTMGG